MRNKMVVTLSLYFALALASLAIVMSSIFVILLRKQAVELHQSELAERASKIAATLSDFSNTSLGDGLKKGNQGNGYGAYIRFIGDIAGTDIWLIDRERRLITSVSNQIEKDYSLATLPDNGLRVIEEVFQNRTVFSEDFSHILNSVSLTVGTPIVRADGEIIGAVLLHSPVDSINKTLRQGVAILLISLSAAICISFALAVYLSVKFTKPLEVMKSQAEQMIAGNYVQAEALAPVNEIGELADALNLLADRLISAENLSIQTEQLRRDFVANISHELKTPITVLKGSLEALNESIVTDEAEVKSYYEQLLIETNYLERMVNALLELAKLQNVDFAINLEPIVFNELVSQLYESFKPLANRKSIRLEMTLPPQEVIVSGDYDRLRQLVSIILDNAIKFSEVSSTVTISMNKNALIITDEGVGISETDLAHIFEKFYKARNESNKTGTGLGLSIAYETAKRHRMRIKPVSVLGQGTTFEIDYSKAKMSQ